MLFETYIIFFLLYATIHIEREREGERRWDEIWSSLSLSLS